MKTKVMWALVVLNVVLLAGLVFRFGRPNVAVAQPAPRPGEYIMVSGEVQGGPAAVVYMIDETNRMLTARTYDENRKQFNDMAPIELDRVFDAARGNVPRRGR